LYPYQVLTVLTALINTDLFTGKSLSTLLQVQAYFQRHHRHIRYQRFEQQQIPLGSGMVESACKWLIQLRIVLLQSVAGLRRLVTILNLEQRVVQLTESTID
jgi:hypothetical protein